MGKIKNWEAMPDGHNWINEKSKTQITIGNPIIPGSSPIEFWRGVHLVTITKNYKVVWARRYDNEKTARKFISNYMRENP